MTTCSGLCAIAATKGTAQDVTLIQVTPKANIVRFEDDATSNTAYLSGQTDLWATLNTIAVDLSKKNPQRETELKFKLRDSPAHMAMRQGDFQLLHWLDTFIFFIKGNGELNRLHKTWLGEEMGNVSVL